MNKLFSILFCLILLSNLVFAILPNGNIHIFAVTEEEKGITAELNLFTISGEGEVAFITSNSLVGKDTQTTGNIALNIAQEETNVDASNLNFIFDIKANASEVDGPSAGAAMTLLTYSLLSEKKLNEKVGITGTIASDGSVGAVGGIGPKAKVASELGLELFMIPTGQSIAYLDNKAVNLLEYGPKELGMKVVEVSTIDEVINYAYSNIDDIVISDDSEGKNFIPTGISYHSSLEPMVVISQGYISRAKNSINNAKKELESTDLEDGLRSSFYNSLNQANSFVDLAQIYLDQNYLYSAANESFNASLTAETIMVLARSPSLLNSDSKILDLKINDLEKEINILKKQMLFFPENKFEWLIGAQQRIAYAENAIKNVKMDVNFKNDDEEKIIQIARVRELVSAQQWIEVAKDFFEESKKDKLKKSEYSEEFVIKVNNKLRTVENKFNDANNIGAEPERRLNAAKISIKNGFYYAALYDIYFAQSFFDSDLRKKEYNPEQLENFIYDVFEKSKIDSFWANIYFDHALFHVEEAKFENSLGRVNEKNSLFSLAYDLVYLSLNLEDVYGIVKKDISEKKTREYIIKEEDTGPVVQIEYIPKYPMINQFAISAIILSVILLMLVLISFKSNNSSLRFDMKRANKLELLLNRLDKALASKKISNSDYFLLKKKYEDEYNQIKENNMERSKITLDLDESKVKLSALQKGLKDLKKYYHAGLIIPEDYEKHIYEINEEIIDIKRQIKNYKKELKKSRTSMRKVNKKLNEFDVKGTKEKVKLEKENEIVEKEKRLSLIEKFRGKR